MGKLITQKAVGISLTLYTLSLLPVLYIGFKTRYFMDTGMSWTASLTIILGYLLIFIVNRMSESYASTYLAATAAILMSANAMAQPLLNYSCNMMDEAKKAGITTFIGVVIELVAMVCGWLLFSWLSRNKQKKHLIFWSACLVSGLLSLMILAFGSSSSGTSTITLFGHSLQPAIFAPILSTFLLSITSSKTFKSTHRVSAFVAAIVLIGSLCLRKEFGIPFVMVSGLLLYFGYYVCTWEKIRNFFTIKKCLIVGAILALIVIAAGAAYLIFPDKFHDLFIDLIHKVERLSASSSQANNAYYNIISSSWAGNTSYDFRVAFSTSDMAMNITTHFLGYAWFMVFISSFLLAVYAKITELSRTTNTAFISNARKIAVFVFAVVIFYNAMYNLIPNYVPIIGVQSLFLGQSNMIFVLSGLLLGILTSSESENGIIERLKNIFSADKIAEHYEDDDEEEAW